MTLIIDNAAVARVLTMEATIAALEGAYADLAREEAVCRPRMDVRIPTSTKGKVYQWGTMEGGSTAGYFAVRMKSDVVYEQERDGASTQEKYCSRPGLYCGLVLLTSIENGEPLAIINDGVLQPDMAKWGGFSGCLPVARAILGAGLRYCPHFLGGGVGLLASAHLLAAVGGDGLLEVDANPNPLRTRLCGAVGAVREGRVILGDAPGLGVEPDLRSLVS